MSHIRTVKVIGTKLTLSLSHTGKRFNTGQIKLAYTFKKGNVVLFQGDDYGLAPAYDAYSDDAIVGIMGFLTMQVGDTDNDYFKDYSKDALLWCASIECDDLKLNVSDLENADDGLHPIAFSDIFEDL